jgi:hypothetical protein
MVVTPFILRITVTWSQDSLPLPRVLSRGAWGKCGKHMNGSWSLISTAQPFGLWLKLYSWGFEDKVIMWLAVPVATHERLVICV